MQQDESNSTKRLLIFSKTLGAHDIGENFILAYGEESIGKDVDFGSFTINKSSYNLAFEVKNSGKNKRNYNKLVKDKERIKFVIKKGYEHYEFNGYLTNLIEEDDGLVILASINKVITL